MLTNLDFLRTGSRWPPESEKERMDGYEAHQKLFEDEHAAVYLEPLKRIERVTGNFSEVVSHAVVFNYQKLLSLKIADLVFGEPPKFTAAKESQQAVIDRVLSETNLLEAAYMACLDVSRYGDGLLLLGNLDGRPVVKSTSPRHWYPVVDPEDIHRIRYHVFAWAYPRDAARRRWELTVQVHDPQHPESCEQHRYALTGSENEWSIGLELSGESETTLDTKLGVCPVFRVPNVLTSDRVFGLDDYQSVDSIVSEIMVRASQISRVLDKHANPSMSGPMSALQMDDVTGQWRLRVGDYYPRNDTDDPELRYITWDASMDANFKQLEMLLNQLHTVSEMGSAIFGDLTSKAGQAPSGSALRRLMISPLAKARRICNHFDPAMKGLLSVCAAIYGVFIAPREISIKWNDGLPDDEAENAQIMSVRTGGKATISQHTAIKRLDDLADSDASAELEEIRADEASQDMGMPEPPHGDLGGEVG